MIICKAQCGLKLSGKCWHDCLHDVLRSMGFTPSKAEEDTWMRDCGDHCKCTGARVDDLIMTSKNPQRITDKSQAKPRSFKLKGTGPVDFHLLNVITFETTTAHCVLDHANALIAWNRRTRAILAPRRHRRHSCHWRRTIIQNWTTLHCWIEMASLSANLQSVPCNGPSLLDDLTLLRQSCPCPAFEQLHRKDICNE